MSQQLSYEATWRRCSENPSRLSWNFEKTFLQIGNILEFNRLPVKKPRRRHPYLQAHSPGTQTQSPHRTQVRCHSHRPPTRKSPWVDPLRCHFHPLRAPPGWTGNGINWSSRKTPRSASLFLYNLLNKCVIYPLFAFSVQLLCHHYFSILCDLKGEFQLSLLLDQYVSGIRVIRLDLDGERETGRVQTRMVSWWIKMRGS